MALDSLVSDIEPDIERELSEEIPKLGRKGAKMLREEASSHWDGVTGERYSKGFSSSKVSSGKLTTAEIGNRNAPGLVHLLEKGHATLTGRRVAGTPHVSVVYDKLEPDVERVVARAVDDALEG